MNELRDRAPVCCRLCVLVVTALLAALSTAALANGPVKVFILAGQSNMQGQGLVQAKDAAGNEKPGTLTAMLADPAKAPLLKHLRTPDGQWVERDDVWVYDVSEFGTAKGPLGFGFGWNLGNKDWFGPEVQFGHVIKTHLHNQVLIIKTAWGGRSLYTDFRPPSSGGAVGPFYTQMLGTVNRVLGNLKQEFPAYDGGGYELAGFVWWHGWNDFCDPTNAVPEYEQNLANLIRDVRRDLKAPKLPVVIGEFTGPWGADCTEPAALAIRRAQAAVAAKPEFRESVSFVPTHDFVRTEGESPTGEGYHEFKNGETYFLIGNALGEGMWDLLSGRPRPPVKVFILAGQSNMEGHGAVSALDKDGNERPGTLTWLLGNPAKAPLVQPWCDDRPVPAVETTGIEATNATFGDPVPGRVKQLRVDYTVGGQRQTKTVAENETLTIAARPGTVVIERAVYGDLPDGVKSDVTAAVRTLVDAGRTRSRWKVRDDVWVWFNGHKGGLTTGFGAGRDLIGPELGFGQVLGDALADPVLIIKTAWGGRSLYKDFRPPSSGGEVGACYRQLLETVNKVLGELPVEFPDLANRRADLAGLVWWHGWNDGIDPENAVPEYERNLVNLIGDLRRDLGVPGLPVVVGELTGPWVQVGGAWGELRAAQAAAADPVRHPELKGNVAFVPTHDFVRAEDDSPGGWPAHEFNNAETYYLVGQACGEAMKKLLAAAPLGGAAGAVDNRPVTANTAIRDYGLKEYVRVSKDLPHAEGTAWKLVCTMPYNCHFQPWIQVEAPAGQLLRFNSSNPLVLYLTPTETCTTIAGTHDYEAREWISGEGAVYTIPPGVTVKAVRYRETGYDTTFAGSFECNDQDFNTLWRKAARTAYLCLRDHFYDCPDRERVGFWGDGTPELNQCFYVFDTASHQLCKDLVLRKLEPDFYPGQHLEFLGEYGLWFYYLHTGDLDSIAAIYDSTKTFLMETYKFGNPSTWFDWGKDSKDTSIIETCFYYIDLGTLRKMALATAHEADLPAIDAKREEIRRTFDTRFWKGSYYQSADVTAPDDRANAMAVNAGLADRAKWDAIYTTVLSKTTNASCFFDRWVFEALCTMGMQDRALMRMATRYRTMIPCSFTTLWEHYDRWWASWLNAFDDASSLNHGWNPPALVLSQDIAGVRPVEPGWATYEVLPKEAFLTSIKVVVPSIKGHVRVEVRKTAREYALSLVSPANTTAIVGIPRGSFSKLDSIAVNGRLVWKGDYRGGAAGVSWVGDDGGYVKLRVAPGTWRFVGRGRLPLDSPKPPPPAPRPEVALDTRTWTATASVPDGSFLFSGAKIPIEVPAANAIDGDHWTGWRDMTKTQYPGQWFQVDMQQRQAFDKIVLDNTWALWDSPQEYAVTVSDDGANWSAPIAVGRGQLGITTITFPRQTARWIRITQTGANPTYHWSIYELNVYRGAR